MKSNIRSAFAPGSVLMESRHQDKRVIDIPAGPLGPFCPIPDTPRSPFSPAGPEGNTRDQIQSGKQLKPLNIPVIDY